MTLAWIMAASVAGGALSVGCAAVFALTVRAAWIPMLVSFAIGALLGAAFLEVIPHAFEAADPHKVSLTILAGILVFFVMEKLVLWRHCHTEHCEGHEPPAAEHDYGRTGLLIVVGDTVHNFVDGVLIAAAFLQSVELGIITALAIVAHEIPQEVGDFLILLHSGYSKTKALLLNMLSSAAMIAGGLLAYFALQTMQQWIAPLLGLAIASMLYVSVADLIPGLHRRPELRATMQQIVLIACGVGTIWLMGELTHSSAAP